MSTTLIITLILIGGISLAAIGFYIMFKFYSWKLCLNQAGFDC